MKNKKTPVYPCIDLSVDSWEDNLDWVLWDSDFLHSADPTWFQNNVRHHEIIDCKGDIYKVIGKEDIPGWRNFIPFAAKSKAVLIFTGKQMSLAELKSFMLKKIDGLSIQNDEVFIQKWREDIISAQTIEALHG